MVQRRGRGDTHGHWMGLLISRELVVGKVKTDDPGWFGLVCASSLLSPFAVLVAADSVRRGRRTEYTIGEEDGNLCHLADYFVAGILCVNIFKCD